MLGLIQEKSPLRNPRNSIAIPFLFRKAKSIWSPVTNILRLIEVGRLSTGLLHDLMGPVTALTIFTSQLSKDDPRTSAVIESSKRIEELLNLTRNQFQSENIAVNFSVKETVQNAMELLRYRAIRNRVRLVSINNEDLYLHGKQIFFYQVVINLISNAIDSYQTENNGIRDVVIKTERLSEFLSITVKDFGCGLTDKQQKKIFKCFYSSKSNGTGIGLCVVQQIVKRNFGGTIKFSSELNKGSTFVVSIPINQK